MIEANGLSFSYGSRSVLRDACFSVAQGGLTALLGRNGAGKTTLFRCLLGLLPGYGGSLRLNGREARGYAPAELARTLAYIPQTSYPAFNYTALDMVLMGTSNRLSPLRGPGREEQAAARDALERMGVGALAERGYLQLSGGERQLVLIARALAQRSPVLLMDEPTASLDYGNQQLLLAQARKLSREGYTVLMSCHNPQQALTYADRVIALEDGRVACDGPASDVLDAALLKRLYGVRATLVDGPHGKLIAPEGSV